jgi:heme exporter protein A
VNRLEARALSASRGAARLFREVSFEVQAGEWLALRGPNGSGKTTLMRCVAGLAQADAGDTLWNGVSTSRERDAYHASLLYAGHLPGIKDDLSAEENLQAALALRGVSRPAADLRAALDSVGLAARRKLAARKLSAGQRRRIGLARLALDPAALWMLDEPLTALDDDGQALFQRLLGRHLAAGGMAVICTHHALAPSPAREVRLGP